MPKTVYRASSLRPIHNSESEVEEDQFEIIDIAKEMASTEHESVPKPTQNDGLQATTLKKPDDKEEIWIDIVPVDWNIVEQDLQPAEENIPGGILEKEQVHLKHVSAAGSTVIGKETSPDVPQPPKNDQDVTIDISQAPIPMSNNTSNGTPLANQDVPTLAASGITLTQTIQTMLKYMVQTSEPWVGGTVQGFKGLRLLFKKPYFSFFDIIPMAAITVGIIYCEHLSCPVGPVAPLLIVGGVIQIIQGKLARTNYSQAEALPNSVGVDAPNYRIQTVSVLNTIISIAWFVWLIVAGWIIFNLNFQSLEYDFYSGGYTYCNPVLYYVGFWFVIVDIVAVAGMVFLFIFTLFTIH